LFLKEEKEMTDDCDAEFFRTHLWPMLEKDFKNLPATNVAAVKVAAEAEFLQHNFKHSRLIQKTSKANIPEKEKMLFAAQQLYPIMSKCVLQLAEQNRIAIHQVSHDDESQ